MLWGFPGSKTIHQPVVKKKSTGQCWSCRRYGFDPWVRKIPCRRKWQPIPEFLPGKLHEQRSLVGYSPRGHKELDTTEQLSNWCFSLIYLSCDSYKDTNPINEDPTLTTSSRTDYLPKALPPNIIILACRVLVCEFFRGQKYSVHNRRGSSNLEHRKRKEVHLLILSMYWLISFWLFRESLQYISKLLFRHWNYGSIDYDAVLIYLY